MATLFQPAPSNTVTEVFPKNGTTFDIEELYAYLNGGWLEAVRMDNGDTMYIDEEGKLKRLAVNMEATVYARTNSDLFDMSQDVIVGPAILCVGKETK